MIGGMLTRLQSTDAADTTRTSWCAKELPKAAAEEHERRNQETQRVELNHQKVLDEQDARLAQQALDGAKDYLAKVQKSCGPGGTDSKALRAGRREQQIADLRNVHDMLNGGLR